MSYSNYPQDDLNNAPVEDPDYTTPEQEPDYQEAASDPWDDGTEAADADDSFLSEEVNEQEDIVSESFPEQEVDNHDENEPSITQENRTKSNQKAEKSSPNLIENIAVGSGKIKDISKNFKEISQNLKDSSNNIKETIKNPKGTPKNSQVPVKTVKKQSQPNQNTSNSNPINTLSSTPWLISFRWNYNGQLKEKTISPEEAVTDNKLNNVVIRIGRDQLSCNLVLEDNSVSRQHAEISFDEQQQMFFIKSLRPRNIIKVDGQNLGEGEKLSLKKDATIVLGKQTIVIADIQFDDLEPTNYVNVRRGDLDGGDKTKVIDYKNVNVKGEDLDEGDKTKVIDYKNVANADSNYIQNWAMNFQWKYDDGKQISKQISQADINTDNRFKGIMRIGRDKNSCVIHLENETVSRQHAEIYFNQEKKRLFIKSLQPKGTKTITMVDDQNLPEGKELPLKESGTITLGTQKLEYTKQKEISQKESKSLWEHPVVIGATISGIISVILAITGYFVTAHSNKENQATAQYTKELEIKADQEKQQNEFEVRQKELYSQKFDEHREEVIAIKEKMKKEKKYYNQLTVSNENCPDAVNIAISFTALDEVSETGGWYSVEQGKEPITTSSATTYGNIFILAKTKIKINDKEEEIKYKSDRKIDMPTVEPEPFRYIKQPFLQSDVEKNKFKNEAYYEVKFKKDSWITRKTFFCNRDQGTLELRDATQKQPE
ncbi:FHA domain-containing protein [Microcystis aeruginosa]|uniref:FHA domain-containing protein n=1 Tax=Microcystis aeruginosa TaxID=1126 RepID=UPI00232A8CD8|nr:FHA domain-containing protein [Microcystis aeruginosa]MDB9390267.1 FHA domain-containing protein [Microcystis aeruginosa CS-579]